MEDSALGGHGFLSLEAVDSGSAGTDPEIVDCAEEHLHFAKVESRLLELETNWPAVQRARDGLRP